MSVLERFGIDEGRKGHIKGLFVAKIGEKGVSEKVFRTLSKSFPKPPYEIVPQVRLELTLDGF